MKSNKEKLYDLIEEFITVKNNERMAELTFKTNDILEMYNEALKFTENKPFDTAKLNPSLLIRTYYIMNNKAATETGTDVILDPKFMTDFNNLNEEMIMKLRKYYNGEDSDLDYRLEYFTTVFDSFKDASQALEVVWSYLELRRMFEFNKRFNLMAHGAKVNFTKEELEQANDSFNKFLISTRNYLVAIKKVNNSFIDFTKESRRVVEDIYAQLETDNYHQLSNRDGNIVGPQISHALNQLVISSQINKGDKNHQTLNELNTQISSEHLGQTLKKYGLSINMFQTKDIIKKYGVEEEINSMLILLKQVGYDFMSSINSGLSLILIASDSKKVSEITHLVVNRTIGVELLYNHPEIFVSKNRSDFLKENGMELQDGYYEEFMAKYNLLKKYGLNIANEYQEDFINIDFETLKLNIAIYHDYKYIFSKTNPLTFLLKPSTCLIADFIVEHNEDLDSVNLDNTYEFDPKLILKRLIISHNVALDYLSSKGILLNSIVSGRSFVVPDNCLDDFLTVNPEMKVNPINEKVLTNELIKYLDEYYLVDGVYIFDDIIISRGKFLRNISSVENINPETVYQALIQGDDYSNIEHERIKKSLVMKM